MTQPLEISLPDRFLNASTASSDWMPQVPQPQVFCFSGKRHVVRVPGDTYKQPFSLSNPYSRSADWIGLSARQAYDPLAVGAVKPPVSSQDATFETVDYRAKKKGLTKDREDMQPKGPQTPHAWAASAQKKFGEEKGMIARGKRTTKRAAHLPTRGATSGHASSLLIKESWTLKDHISLSALGKLKSTVQSVSAPTDIACHGVLPVYTNGLDYIDSTSKPLVLRASKCTHYYTSAIEDPVMRDAVLETLGEIDDAADKLMVVINDYVLATLMTAPRAVFAFDFQVTKSGNVMFFDLREGDDIRRLTTVDETSTCPPHDQGAKAEDAMGPASSASALATEAFQIGESITQFAADAAKRGARGLGDGTPHVSGDPFADEDKPATKPAAKTFYRYRKWQLRVDASGKAPEGDVLVLCRTSLDGTQRQAATAQRKAQAEPYRIFAANEHAGADAGQAAWKNKIVNGKGAILANYVKCNACKVAKWVSMALLSGAQKIKIAFVSRANASSSRSHTVLGVDTKTPAEFAAQVGLNADTLWGNVAHIVQKLQPLDDGQYAIAKDAGKPSLAVYQIVDGDEEDEVVSADE